MKREGFEGFIALALVAALALGGCSAAQQKEITAAYIAAQQEKARAVIACANRPRGVATCGLMVAAAYGGGGTESVPVVRSDLDVVLNSSVLGATVSAAGQVVQSNNATKVAIRQTEASERIAETQATERVETMRAVTGSNAAIANGGFTAIGATAGAGFGALGTVAAAAVNVGGANVAVLADMVTKLPPTIQAGGSVTQAGGAVDQSVTGGHRVQDSQGVEVEVTRPIICTATGGNTTATAGGFTASTTGATSALNPGYDPLFNITPAPVSNNCGNG